MSGDDTPLTPSRPSLHSSAAGPASSNGNTRGAGPAGLSVLASIGPGPQSSGRRTARLWWGSALLLGLAGGAGLWLASAPRAVDADVQARAVAPSPVVAVAAPVPVVTSPSASASASAPAADPAAASAARIENVSGPASAVATAASAPLAAVAKAAQKTTPRVRTASAHKTPHQSAQRTALQPALKPRPAGTAQTATAGPDRGEPPSAISPAAFGPKRDTDVDLLEALVAHGARPARAVPPPKAAGTASVALSQQIERCNAPGVADAVACLAKACASRGPEDARCAAPARAP